MVQRAGRIIGSCGARELFYRDHLALVFTFVDGSKTAFSQRIFFDELAFEDVWRIEGTQGYVRCKIRYFDFSR